MKTVSGTKEWAASNENIQIGCEHDCIYCYAKCMALRFGRASIASWAKPVLRQKRLGKAFKKRQGRIMFPTTHDITPANIIPCVNMLHKMLSAGNDVLIVSKPHVECISVLCKELKEFRNQILFRFTMGSADDSVLTFWEPGAPTFSERLAAITLAYNEGFPTSVSCEPMLDAHIDTVIAAVAPFVTDAIWLGKANRLRQTIALTAPGNIEAKRRTEELIAMQNDDAIRQLHNQFKDHPKLKWKESIKKVIGIEIPTEAGLDI